MADLHTYRKLPSDPCLTQEQITAYIDGALSSAEQHACEQHMLDCEMCEDAVEGLALVKDRSVLSTPLKAAETPAEGKVIPLQQPNRRVWYAVAAVLVLVLGTTFMLRRLSSDSENTMAENKSVAPDSISAAPAPGLTLTDEQMLKSDSSVVMQSEFKNAEGRGIEGQTNAEAADFAPPQPGIDNVYEGQESIEEAPAQTEETDNAENVAISVPAKNEALAEKSQPVEDRKDKNKKNLLEYAKDGLASGSPKTNKQNAYVDANRADDATEIAPAPNVAQATTTQTYTLSNSNTPDSAIYMTNGPVLLAGTTTVADTASVDQLELSYRNGVTQLNAGQANSAIVLFDKVLANKNHARYEDAEYQKAKALIKANRKEEAKTLLKAIEAKKGKHAAEATTLLKTL
jgi:hypothetical protein